MRWPLRGGGTTIVRIQKDTLPPQVSITSHSSFRARAACEEIPQKFATIASQSDFSSKKTENEA